MHGQEKASSEISKADTACRAVLDAWMSALNEHDVLGMDAVMHFPHVRHAEGRVTVYSQPGSNPFDLFAKLRDRDGWHHSQWTKIDLVQASPVKLHYALRYTRFREDLSVIGEYDSLYALTFENERWGIQIRSSFGP